MSNSGGGSLNFTTSTSLNSGVSANWLSVTPQSGTATPGNPVALAVKADPSSTGPGTYTGNLTIQGGSAASVTIPITTTVTANPVVMLLSQAGLTFTAVQNGGAIPPQTFGVLSLGSGTLNWSVQTSTLPAGGSWLIATPDSGSSVAAAPSPPVTVSVNPAGLQPGVYYGLVTVVSAGAANTPQEVVAVLRVLPPGTDVAPVVQPSSLIFTAPAANCRRLLRKTCWFLRPYGNRQEFQFGDRDKRIGSAGDAADGCDDFSGRAGANRGAANREWSEPRDLSRDADAAVLRWARECSGYHVRGDGIGKSERLRKTDSLWSRLSKHFIERDFPLYADEADSRP